MPQSDAQPGDRGSPNRRESDDQADGTEPPHIFERFYRAGPPSSHSGSGLGLAIVAEVAAAYGGSARGTAAALHGLRVILPVRAHSAYSERQEAALAARAGSPAG